MIDANQEPVHLLRLATLAAGEVRQYIHEYADCTDRPIFEAVQVADLLDSVITLLERAVAALPEQRLLSGSQVLTVNASRDADASEDTL